MLHHISSCFIISPRSAVSFSVSCSISFPSAFPGRGSQGGNRLLGLVLLGGPHEVGPHHGPSRCGNETLREKLKTAEDISNYHDLSWIDRGSIMNYQCIMDVSWIYLGCLMFCSWMYQAVIMDLAWIYHGFSVDLSCI